MANNRMWLVNDRTGQRVLLAKYYPGTGWYTIHDGHTVLETHDGKTVQEPLHQRLDVMFDEDDTVSMWGPTDYRLEYEITEKG